MPEPLANTKSVCPVCLRGLPTKRELRGDEAWLVKQCPEHGIFETLIWKGPPDIREWSRPKTPFQGGPRTEESSQGCPWDCGLCVNHSQRTCTAVLEITARCDLGCPVCFASSGDAAPPDPSKDKVKGMLKRVWEQTGGCNLQFSGGEPTMRDDLPELVEAAAKAGFSFVQLNTNGLKLAADKDLCRRLAGAGLSSLFLQFDGMRASDHLALRGRDLLAQKLKAVENAADAGLGAVLVPTIKAGVNQDQLWDLVKFGISQSPGVRGVHFQPMAFFGRYPKAPDPRSRITLPQIMRGLQEQSSGKIKAADFSPPGCEHSLCSFSARYVVNPDQSLTRLGRPQAGCCTPEPAVRGALRSIQNTARQWSGQMLPELVQPIEDQDPFAKFLHQAQSQGFSISGMAFQDAWSLDLERLQGCCIHVATDLGSLVPFCAYNLSSASGNAPHRQKSWG